MPTVTLKPSSALAGQPIIVSGGGFSPGATLTVDLDGAAVASMTADRRGNYSTTIQAPASAGPHTVLVHAGVAATLTVTTPVPPPPSPTYLFSDEFDGPAGSPPDPTKWFIHADTAGDFGWAQPKDTNAYLDGNSHLILRLQREAAPYLGQGPFSGGWISTFLPQSGWPPAQIKASWPVPYRIEMRALQPATPGAWTALWPETVDKPASGPIYELDVAEERLTDPTSFGCHQHAWVNDTDTHAWDGGVTPVSDMTKNWHVYSADVRTTGVDYSIDSQPAGTAYGVSGKFGAVLSTTIGPPGSWADDGGFPDPNDPGPWLFQIDWVRVSALIA